MMEKRSTITIKHNTMVEAKEITGNNKIEEYIRQYVSSNNNIVKGG